MIPKIIHYCWFGRGEKTDLVKKCIASWKKYCPDYEIIEWNEKNFNISLYPYARYCLENNKYAFLSDFVRLIVIKEQGGFYFDTDVELIKNLDNFLHYGAVYSFENKTNVNTGQGFGAEAGHPTVCAMYEQYLKIKPEENGVFPLTACPALNTKALLPFGLKLNGNMQTINDMIILPSDYMNPFDTSTGVLIKTNNTISIHWYSMSWLPRYMGVRLTITRFIRRLLRKTKR